MLDFTDTQKTFSKISTWKLRKEVFLFTIMNAPWWSKVLQRCITWALRNGLPVEFLLRRTVFEHFCGGQLVEDCNKTIDRLFQKKITTILDYSKEHGEESTYDVAVDEVIKTIAKATNNPTISFAVFKFTSIADMEVLEKMSSGNLTSSQQQDENKIRSRVHRLCQYAFDNKVKILVDAEHSWIQNAIDKITEEMMLRYNKQSCIVYHTVQMYRHDRLVYLKNLHQKLASHGVKTGVKLVRGAYMDIERARALQNGYASPIHTTKQDTDADYDAALQYILRNLQNMEICAGTHNQSSVALLARLMDVMNIHANDTRIYHAQLLGMADYLSNTLAEAGYNVAKYVPYGKIKEVIPYLLRRADENRSVLGELSYELKIRKAELKRRASL